MLDESGQGEALAMKLGPGVVSLSIRAVPASCTLALGLSRLNYI